MISFTVGGIIPLLGGVFIRDPRARLASVAVRLPSCACCEEAPAALFVQHGWCSVSRQLHKTRAPS